MTTAKTPLRRGFSLSTRKFALFFLEMLKCYMRAVLFYKRRKRRETSMHLTKKTIVMDGFIAIASAFGTGHSTHANEVKISSAPLPQSKESSVLFEQAEKIGIRVEAMVEEGKKQDAVIAEKVKKFNKLNKNIIAYNLKLENIEDEQKKAEAVLVEVNFDKKLKLKQWEELPQNCP